MAKSRSISNNKKRKLQAFTEQAKHALAIGRLDACESICNLMDEISENLPITLALRGAIAEIGGQLPQAQSLFEQAAGAEPDTPEFTESVGRILERQHRYNEAADFYRKALIKHKNKKQAISAALGLSASLINARRHHEAAPALEKLNQDHPRNADILYLLGSCHLGLKNLDIALQYYQEALSAKPGHAEALRQIGQIELQKGNKAESEDAFREAINTASLITSRVYAFTNLVTLKTYTNPEDEDIDTLQDLYKSLPKNSTELESVSFTLGKIYDDLKQPDKAFPYYLQGNTLRSQREPYYIDVELDHLRQIMDTYQSDVFSNNSGLSDSTPIFVTGMPRCGSTLTEQILASHRDIEAKGESNRMEGLALARQHTDDNPLTLERIASFTQKEWQQVGKDYLEASAPDEGKSRTTDKSLNNIRLVGAIHCALPHAKIIHVRRHPLDTCWSIYKHNLDGQLFGFGNQLTSLGRYYKMYQRLMDHWRSVLPEGVMLEINYEDLVNDQKAVTRQMLEFCDLPWDENCLQFYKLRNQVDTSSLVQVRKPMYKDAVAAWQRYEQHLQPLIKILGTEGWNSPKQ